MNVSPPTEDTYRKKILDKLRRRSLWEEAERQHFGRRYWKRRIWKVVNSPIVGWLLTYVLIGTLGAWYTYQYLPQKERESRRDKLLFELAFRTSLAIEKNQPNVLDGEQTNYLTSMEFYQQPFRTLALDLRGQIGESSRELTQFAIQDLKNIDLQELSAFLKKTSDYYDVRVITPEELKGDLKSNLSHEESKRTFSAHISNAWYHSWAFFFKVLIYLIPWVTAFAISIFLCYVWNRYRNPP